MFATPVVRRRPPRSRDLECWHVGLVLRKWFGGLGGFRPKFGDESANSQKSLLLGRLARTVLAPAHSKEGLRQQGVLNVSSVKGLH